LLELLEYSGSFLALLGATMVARNDKHSKWGFVAFVISNFLLSTWSIMMGAYGLLTLNVFYLCINVYGINKWFKLKLF